MPKMTKAFLVRLTKRFVNIIEMALVSLVTRVTSLAHRDVVQLAVGEAFNVGEKVFTQIGDDALAHTLQMTACK